MEASLTPIKVPPPSLASALSAGDLEGLLGLLANLDAPRASLEPSTLLELLSHSLVDVSRAAAVACSRVRHAPAVSRLRGILTDGESTVGPDVLAALRGWLLPEWIESYRQLLDTPDYPWKGQVLLNLSDHASAEEYSAIRESSWGRMYVLGALLALLYYVPLLNLMVPVLSGLAFTHFGLARLAEMRGPTVVRGR